MGSNLGDRAAYLAFARRKLEELPDFALGACSGIDETDPIEYFAQPRFLNQVVSGETKLSPWDLLERLFEIEHKLGRTRKIPKGPRTIDLDLLLYGDMVCRDERLILPHPGIKRRPFVIKELLEIDSSLTDPETGETYREVYLYAQNNKHQ